MTVVSKTLASVLSAAWKLGNWSRPMIFFKDPIIFKPALCVGECWGRDWIFSCLTVSVLNTEWELEKKKLKKAKLKPSTLILQTLGLDFNITSSSLQTQSQTGSIPTSCLQQQAVADSPELSVIVNKTLIFFSPFLVFFLLFFFLYFPFIVFVCNTMWLEQAHHVQLFALVLKCTWVWQSSLLSGRITQPHRPL